MVLLTVATIVLVLALVAVLVTGLVKIVNVLEDIGGGGRAYMGENMGHGLSLLAKARWGVRAIERQTAPIAPEVTRLNEGLGALDASLAEVEASMGGILAALRRQGGDR